MTPSEIQTLHDAYCKATGFALRPDYMRSRAWFDFAKAGFLCDDLLLVIRYLKREIARGNRNPGALKFSNLVIQLDHFEEDLALAKQAGLNAQRSHAVAVRQPPDDRRPSDEDEELTDDKRAEAVAAIQALRSRP